MKIYIGKSMVSLKRIPAGEEIIDEGLYGMEAEMKERLEDWIKIRMFYGYEGWVPADAVACVTVNVEMKRRMRIVRAPFADIKMRPDIQAETVLCVPRGAWLTVWGGEKQDGWLTVWLLSGRRGYVPAVAVAESVQKTETLFRNLPVPEQRKRLVHTALSYLETPYRWGGRTPLGIDCSGLAQMTYLQNGITIYRDAQLKAGYPVKEIATEKKCPGDLLYFPGHMAVYLGNQKYIHSTAAWNRHCVTINSLNPSDSDYRPDLARSLTAVGSIY